MDETEFENILVINFGQIGDVISSLPAMQCIRNRFPKSKITVMVGLTAKGIIETTDSVDQKIVVDRVALRDSNKFWSVLQILKLVQNVRRQRFDLVIDLHSLSETNLLGFLSGAKSRLFANRGNRSLDYLSNFRPKPPKENPDLRLSESYLKVLEPLGVKADQNDVRIRPSKSDIERVRDILTSDMIEKKELIGINPGAGHPSRQWKLDNFAKLAKLTSQRENAQILVFCGPEEKPMQDEIEAAFGSDAIIYRDLNLRELTAAFSFLQILIGNDTGPMHLGAAVGTPVLYIMGKEGPLNYIPASSNYQVVRSGTLDEISVDEVYRAALKLL